MKGYKFILIVGAICLAASALLYTLHYQIFQDTHHIYIYMLGDFAFLPLEVFLVVVIIERVLARREKQAVLYKMNMVIGAFFSEIGNYLLGDLVKDFKNRGDIARNLNVSADWTAKEFKRATNFAYSLKIDLDIRDIDLEGLKKYLSGKRMYLLTLLENPNLLEHDRFTDLLWATTHLDEELEARASLKDLSKADLEHLAVDIQRMYDHLASEWLDYAQHLKANYPFLFSLVLRTHPFQEKPSAAFA
ncbi:MAG: hypothetical protein A2Y89_07740 [Chloroflexi bacterium RBG_13_51_18]|nr:MAG: hypothetical protein A2Y89_07740 [Chloroflexi bacterium RBG_13_51_18]